MLDITLGLYQIGLEYMGRSPNLLVCVIPALQWTRRYCTLGSSLIFDWHFTLINALHVDSLSRRYQSSLIPASTATANMVLPTRIMLELSFFILSMIGSVYSKSCFEVCKNMSPGDGGPPHSLVGDPIIILHEASLAFTKAFRFTPPRGLLVDLPCSILLNDYASHLILV